MKELTLIQKFDAVLKALYDISDKRPTFGRIIALLKVRKKNIHWGEVWDILNKMRDEKLIRDTRDTESKIPSEILHLITFEGKLMHERKGLKGKLYRDKFTKRRINVISALTLIIAGLSFYFSQSSVKDNTLTKVNETMQTILWQQARTQKLEKRMIKTLQNIADSLSKRR